MSRIRLTWNNASTTIVEQRVYRSTSPLDTDDMPAPLAVLPRRDREYLDSTIEDGLTYYYAVSSVLPDYSELISEEIEVDATPDESDPYWDDVVALLHFDGNLTDETGRVWINSGVTTDNTSSLYDGYGVFSGSSRMTATIPALGTDDFTIEAWVNRDADTDYRCIFDSRASNSRNGLAIYISSPLTGNVPVIWEDTQIIQGSSGIPASGWVNIAVVRESGVLYYYVNGSLIGSGSFTSDLTNTTAIIGTTFQTAQSYRGYLDEFRITEGVARYTGNFTPPTEPFPNN